MLLPVLNKVDLPSADPQATAAQMVSTFDINPDGKGASAQIHHGAASHHTCMPQQHAF